MATQGNRPTVLSNSHVGEMKGQFDSLRIDEVLDVDAPFTAREIDRGRYETKKLLKALRRFGAIEVVGDVRVEDLGGDGRSRVNEYRWKPSVVEYLNEYKDERAELPCGCRAHIHHNNDGGFGCRYCDDDPVFDREAVEEAMSE